MNSPIQILKLMHEERSSAICRRIIDELPGWFGIPEANDRFVREVAGLDCIAAFEGEEPIGLMSLRGADESIVEIHWLGIRPRWHRQGIGTRMMEQAFDLARQKGFKTMTVDTIHPRDPDPGYIATRAFYSKCGFSIFGEYNLDDPINPICRMRRSL